MTGNDAERLLQETRHVVEDAVAEISEAVVALESGTTEPVEDLLASAMARLKILDEQIKRHQGARGRAQ